MTTMLDRNGRAYDPASISGEGFWVTTAEQREKTFRILRDERPISWHAPIQGGIMEPENAGFWAITRHEHIQEVSKNPTIFCSGQGVQFEEVPEDMLEASHSFLALDAPRHGSLRRLVSSAFTPKHVTKLNDQIKNQARQIVDGLIAAGDCDFVDQVSKKLPMWTVYEMMGLDPDQRELAAHLADDMVGWNDEDIRKGRDPGELMTDSLVGLLTMGLEFADLRRREPTSDLMTNLVNAEIDGEKLSDDDIAAFFVLISVAGNDTTRNTISLAAKALADHPDQKALLLENFEGHIGPAIEEFLRWASPVMTFRRTVTEDTVLGGQELKAGEWVAMIYSSGNRDDRVFDNPYDFDITRPKNPHLGFGGGGPHFCMGNFVAKMQLREIFDQLLHRVPDLSFGEPEYLAGNFIHAVKSMPCTIGGTRWAFV